jgi:hypothetical protein
MPAVWIKRRQAHNLGRNLLSKFYPAEMNPPDPEPMMSLDKFIAQHRIVADHRLALAKKRNAHHR